MGADVTFLLDRLDELDWSQDKAEIERDFHGHVAPAVARLRATPKGLTPLERELVAGLERLALAYSAMGRPGKPSPAINAAFAVIAKAKAVEGETP